MPRISAGLLMYRRRGGLCEVLLAHPGGPFYLRKDDGAWTVPKGEPAPGEELLSTAVREFQEEIGAAATGPFLSLSPIRQAGGKLVHAWAFEGDLDVSKISSNTFSLEWPPRSGRRQAFPEVDRAGFFTLPEARRKINPAQVPLLDELERLLQAVPAELTPRSLP